MVLLGDNRIVAFLGLLLLNGLDEFIGIKVFMDNHVGLVFKRGLLGFEKS